MNWFLYWKNQQLVSRTMTDSLSQLDNGTEDLKV